MTPTLGTEKSTVQDPIIKYAGEIYWNVVPREDALSFRKGKAGRCSIGYWKKSCWN